MHSPGPGLPDVHETQQVGQPRFPGSGGVSRCLHHRDAFLDSLSGGERRLTKPCALSRESIVGGKVFTDIIWNFSIKTRPPLFSKYEIFF